MYTSYGDDVISCFREGVICKAGLGDGNYTVTGLSQKGYVDALRIEFITSSEL